MKELHNLKQRLCDELAAFSQRDISSSNLEMIDKLAHATKNIGKVIEMCEDEEYSNEGSYARGRGRNARRDSMGRYASDGMSRDYGSYNGYSRDEDMVTEMRRIAGTLPANERSKMERLIMRVEQM